MTPPMLERENFVLPCRHADYAGVELDFFEFATGADAPARPGLMHLWGGSFSVRPKLALELSEAISLVLGASKPRKFRHAVGGFRSFWRFLDSLESSGLEPVEELADLDIAHGVLWVRSTWNPPYSTYQVVRDVLETARDLAGMDPLAWISVKPTPAKPAEILSPAQAKLLYSALKRRVFEAHDRWRRSDDLARQGRNLLLAKHAATPPSNVTQADLHRTYRSLIKQTGNPAPTSREFVEALGYGEGKNKEFNQVTARFWNAGIGIRELISGLYPTKGVLQDFFHLFLIQTGWNPQTTLDLDISNEAWAVQIGGSESDIYRLSSFKVRAGQWQTTISRGKPTQSPYRLVRDLAERTRPLRNAVSQSILGSEQAPAVIARSPWLFVRTKQPSLVNALDEGTYDSNSGGHYLRTLCAEINEREIARTPAVTSDPAIPMDVRATDFRDVFIGNEFLQSGYNFVIAMLAAGHKRLRTTRRYLLSRAWRQHSEASVRRLMDHLWGELEVNRICDPAILRALVERGAITAEQRDRWARNKDKTYLGMGCANPTNPPKHIDPTHDGSSICRNQHRCTLCEHGIVFPESLVDLAKRKAEIVSLQEGMSLAAWARATELHSEQLSLEETLKQFPENLVVRQVRHWRDEIKAGRHFPLEWEGLHA